jgi:hypothetical protein
VRHKEEFDAQKKTFEDEITRLKEAIQGENRLIEVI